MFPAVESKFGVEAMLGVPGRAEVGCPEEGIQAAVSVLAEEVILGAAIVVALFPLPPIMEDRVGRWKVLENLFLVLLGVHGLG